MKTHSIEWSQIPTRDNAVVLKPARQLQGLLRLATRAFLALVPALAIVVGAAWLVTLPNAVLYLQVLTWVSGFVFLGLAVESESAELSILNLATGIALPALALLSSYFAVELTIVAAALVAAWVAAAILQR
jgi:hypothetical protein